jgi:hypothetical protein
MMLGKIAFGISLAAAAHLSGCAASPASRVPYPAFVQAQELDDAYTAALPGTRAKQLFLDGRHGNASLLLLLPADWTWNAGGAPGKSVEIYVLEGEIMLGDLALLPGNYAWLPPGSTALPMSTDSGARLLYFMDDVDPQAVIRTPLFMSREVVPWQPLSEDPADAGLQRKVLRADPGSGARTYLLMIAPEAGRRWYESSVATEGYLLSGDYHVSECVAGEAVTGTYSPSGYFRRPAGAVSGGPESGSDSGAVWLIRESARGVRTYHDSCPSLAPGPASEREPIPR